MKDQNKIRTTGVTERLVDTRTLLTGMVFKSFLRDLDSNVRNLLESLLVVNISKYLKDFMKMYIIGNL